MPRQLRVLLRPLIAFATAYAVFASLVSVTYTATYGLSRWTQKPDTTAIFPFLILINLVTWVGYVAWMPAIFWLGRRFRFNARNWAGALAVHVPASFVITSVHLTIVASCRFVLQGVRGGSPEWGTTVMDAFFRSLDQTLPVYWAIVGLQSALDHSRQARARELRSARLEARLLQSQLHALQQQIHPHFLFNTLHAISCLVHRDPNRADAMIERLSSLLRLTLGKVGVHEVALAEELEYLQAYLDIEQVHFGHRLRIEHRIEELALTAMVPTLILQPVVESVIRQRLEPSLGGGRVTIQASLHGEALHLRISDDGSTQPKRWQGPADAGLASIRLRLDRLYGTRASLTIRDTAGGGVVDVSLPLHRSASRPHEPTPTVSEEVA